MVQDCVMQRCTQAVLGELPGVLEGLCPLLAPQHYLCNHEGSENVFMACRHSQ